MSLTERRINEIIAVLEDSNMDDDICMFCAKSFDEHNDDSNCKGNYNKDFLTEYEYETTDISGVIRFLKFVLKNGEVFGK